MPGVSDKMNQADALIIGRDKKKVLKQHPVHSCELSFFSFVTNFINVNYTGLSLPVSTLLFFLVEFYQSSWCFPA